MDVAQLIGRLDALCKDPTGNEEEIAELLDKNTDLAEYDVARFTPPRPWGAASSRGCAAAIPATGCRRSTGSS